MAKIKRRKSSKLFSSPRKKTRGSKFNQMGLVNSGIAVMSLLLVAFIFSFSERQVQSGVPIEVKFPSMPNTPKLATEISGSEIITVAIRRTNIGQNTNEENLLDVISPEKIAAIALSIFLKNNKEASREKFVSNELKDSVNPWVIQGRQIILNQENSTSNNSWRKTD